MNKSVKPPQLIPQKYIRNDMVKWDGHTRVSEHTHGNDRSKMVKYPLKSYKYSFKCLITKILTYQYTLDGDKKQVDYRLVGI